MKKILLFSILFTTLQLFSQNYTPFPENVAVWDVYFQPGEPNLQVKDYTRYLMKGDTTINNVTYNKIYSFGYQIHYPPKPIVFTKTEAFGIRQDIAKKKVYRTVVVKNKTIDTLLYDYNLNLGDTIPVTFTTGNQSFPQTVAAIDSISFHGKKYRRFKLSPIAGVPNAALIEGVGNANGLIEPHYGIFEAGYILTDFCNSDHSDCTVPLALEIKDATKDQLQVVVYPNPFSDKLTIVFNEDNGKYNIAIIDILGKEIRKFDFIGKELAIPKDEMKSGIYFLKISGKGAVFIQKIIVQ